MEVHTLALDVDQHVVVADPAGNVADIPRSEPERNRSEVVHWSEALFLSGLITVPSDHRPTLLPVTRQALSFRSIGNQGLWNQRQFTSPSLRVAF